ncbi:hypothetical protein CCACVL1_04752 [Corchorus capsularis]|uniref:Uncharacterized protein n=1 Tax=Corchorus capsularis TaxID=210143 RepID=A0A1R3JPS6_COCAP|nr:hypothetical protein CCACVL1_04752 [Corchorus capsularis]
MSAEDSENSGGRSSLPSEAYVERIHPSIH